MKKGAAVLSLGLSKVTPVIITLGLYSMTLSKIVDYVARIKTLRTSSQFFNNHPGTQDNDRIVFCHYCHYEYWGLS